MFNEIPKMETKKPESLNFENWLKAELPKQYEEKVKILKKLRILEILPEAEDVGLVGIDGKEYPLPEMEEIHEAIEKNKEIFEAKMKQGFTELQIIPFGASLQKLIGIMEKTILKHHQEGKLFTAKKNLKDENEPLEKLDLYDDCETNPDHSPVWKEDYYNVDTEGKLVYYPEEFSKDRPHGRTKKEMLNETKKGFIITLHEADPNIQKEKDQPEIIGGRERLRANRVPDDYLKILRTEKQYQNEQGQIPEEWITKFLAYLEKHNQVIDEYRGNGRSSFQLGAYFPFSDNVPYARWDSDYQRVDLNGRDQQRQDENFGARSSARVL